MDLERSEFKIRKICVISNFRIMMYKIDNE